jgi:hypothetical protein
MKGDDVVAAVNGVFAIGTVLSGLTVRLLVRDTWGNGAGLVAATIVTTILLLLPTSNHAPRPTPHAPRITNSWLLFATAILIVVAKLALIDQFDNPLRHTDLADGQLRNVDVPAAITFGDEFVLLGHDALPTSVSSDERLEVQTYWRALQPGGPDYGVTVNVVDAQGYRWNDTDIRSPRWHRTPPPVREWPPDQYALIALSVPLLPGTPPGTYTVELVAFDHSTLAPLTAHDAGGRALGPALPLGQTAITAPRHPTDPDTLGIRRRLDIPQGPLTLLGADFDRDQAAPGDPVLVTTYWRADQRPAEDLAVHLALLAADGFTAAGYNFSPSGPWHPTSAWQTGDTWRGQHLFHLPANLKSGHYTWELSTEPNYQPADLPATIHITAPPRTFAPPSFQYSANFTLGDLATLVGFDLEAETMRPGEPLTVTLVWRAEQETHISYHVFLHLLGSDGTLVAQSDGIPAEWNRPTTGWLPGEYIADVRVLTVPPGIPAGDYAISVGLYNPNGERLTTSEGTDALPITTVTAGPP